LKYIFKRTPCKPPYKNAFFIQRIVLEPLKIVETFNNLEFIKWKEDVNLESLK
jgi:hypothetical protein